MGLTSNLYSYLHEVDDEAHPAHTWKMLARMEK